MTAKEHVQHYYPNARSVKHSIGEFKYWLIIDQVTKGKLSEGKTESKAWVNAKKDILDYVQLSK